MSFEGFCETDFDAYLPRKWQSHLFNRERLEVKQKLVALGREIGGALKGADGVSLLAEPSVEHPALWNHQRVEAQHLYFTRGEDARRELDGLIDKGRPLAALIEDGAPYQKHVVLALLIDHERFEIALRLHADARVDRQNLERKVVEYFQREKLVHLLRTLPADYRVGVVGGAMLEPGAIDDDALRALLGALPDSGSSLFAGTSLPRADARVRGQALAACAQDGLERLLPIYRFIAWTRENDFLSVREELRKVEVARRAHGLAKGDRVRIVQGMLSGKAGVVQSVDPQGGLRVLMGVMSVKVGVADVAKT
ncbi:MAG: hypothetical protein AABZ30_14705 [Myxococcota bacterium]